MIIKQDSFDVNPPGGSRYRPAEWKLARELVTTHDRLVASARSALEQTTDEHLMTSWKFLAAGRVVSEDPRYVMIQESVFSHLAHHRGQLTVYLRLNQATVPAIYGPSADEGKF